jgi:hypothetical protein
LPGGLNGETGRINEVLASEPLLMRDQWFEDRDPRNPGSGMSLLSLQGAAELLNVSEEVLLRWEDRFGRPPPVSAPDGRRLYDQESMEALRDALEHELSVRAALDRVWCPRGRSSEHVGTQNSEQA